MSLSDLAETLASSSPSRSKWSMPPIMGPAPLLVMATLGPAAWGCQARAFVTAASSW